MTRHELRECTFKLVFRLGFHKDGEEIEQQRELFSEIEDTLPEKEADAEFVTARFDAVYENIDAIDKLINESTTGWDTTRVGKVELAILRLAVYEIKFDEDIPVAVAVNEAVELAKKYGQENSGSFVNAVLTNVQKTIGI